MNRLIPQTKPARMILVVSACIGILIRLFIIFTDEGIYWPDEIYQSFEPAHHLVYGYGLMPWEYIEGARNWALPGLIAGILKACSFLGGDSPYIYIRITKIFFALMSLVTALGIYRLAVVYKAGELFASLSASLFALCTPILYFSHRAMSENASALPIIWGLALVLDRDSRMRELLIGASLLGMAVLLRLQAAVFCVGAVGILLFRRDWKRGIVVILMLIVWATAYGGLDALTWHSAPNTMAGGWFHSAIVYFRFNIIEGKGAAWGVAPWTYYIEHLWTSMPILSIILLIGALLAIPRAPGLIFTAAGFFAIHFMVAHKELRFMVPVLPVLFALVPVGLSQFDEKRIFRIVVPVMIISLVLSLMQTRIVTFGDLGAYPDRANDSAWDDFGDFNRLLLKAGRQDDICGILIDLHLAWTGGSTYLHKKVPIYYTWYPPEPSYFNYEIFGNGREGEVAAKDKGLVLIKKPNKECTPDPGYTWLLP